MIQVNLTTITPAMAQQLLVGNINNRPHDVARSARLAQAILRGEWSVNGDTIRVSKSGRLLDGQHRLHAIAMGNRSVDTLLATNLDDAVFDTIDVGGKPRTAAHIMTMKGEKNATLASSVARLRFKWSRSGNPFNGNQDLTPTVKELEEIVRLYPSVRNAANTTTSMPWCRRAIQPSIVGFCYSVFSEYNALMTTAFFEALETGLGLEAGSPIILLRDRLVDPSKKEVMSAHYKCALIFKAFKYFCDGATVKTLRVRTEGDAPESNLFQL